MASAFASRRVARPGSLEVERPGRRVMPKAVNVAPSLRSSENRSVSVGLDGRKAALREEFLRDVAVVRGEALGAARGGKLLQRINEHGPRALPGDSRMHVEKIDRLVVGKRAEPDRRAVHGGDERELTFKPPRELLLVVGTRGPSLLLARGVVVGGQLLDAGAENLGKQRRVLDEERPQSELGMGDGHHRATSQVVPSFESFSTTPIAASSSRMRSASAKSLALRAESRAAMRRSISSTGN